MTTDTLITADASRVSPASFLRSLGLVGEPASYVGRPQTTPDADGYAFVEIDGGWHRRKVTP